MCGIAGLASNNRLNKSWDEHLFSLQSTLNHRGPDSWGYYLAPDNKVMLFNSRLAITGKTNGLQPIPNENKTVWVTCNGEIYNYKALKKSLETKGHRFRTDSDVETIVHLYEEQGIDFINQLRGEFSFSIYDQNKNCIFLIRDRFGIKPLSYCIWKNVLYFGSEVKSVFLNEEVPRQFDAHALNNLFHSFCFSSETVFKNIKQVPPAHYLKLDLNDFSTKRERYWKMPLGRMESKVPLKDEKRMVGEFYHLLKEAISIRVPEEVPFGTYLSGGLDSCAITAILSENSSYDFDTYSIFFKDKQYDESKYVKLLCDTLKLKNHTVQIGPGALQSPFIRSLWHSEIPVVNTHGTAKFLLSQAASQKCKVILTGEGADEILLGYKGFEHLGLLGNSTGDKVSKRNLGKVMKGNTTLNGISKSFKLTHYDQVKNIFGNYPYPLLRYYAAASKNKWLLTKRFKQLSGDFNLQGIMEQNFDLNDFKGLSSIEATQLFLLNTDLPCYILNYLGDRQEMAHSIEGRVPFLDHVLVEFCCKLPLNMKLRDTTSKYILRESLAGLIPPVLRQRSKKIFLAPALKSLGLDIEDDFFESLLSPAFFKEVGIFKYPVYKMLKNTLKIISRHSSKYAQIEGVLMFVISIQALYEIFIKNFDKYREAFSSREKSCDLKEHDCDLKYHPNLN